MLKILYECPTCGDTGEVENTAELIEVCPKCKSTETRIKYTCNMKLDEFLNELHEMSAQEILSNHDAIKLCISYLKDNS